MNELQTRRPSLFAAALFYLITAVGLFLTQNCLGSVYALLHRLLPGLSASGFSGAAQVLFYVFFIALPLTGYLARHPEHMPAFRPNPLPVIFVVLVVPLAICGIYFVNALTTLWMLVLEALGGNPFTEASVVCTNIPQLVSSIFLVAVIPGICEEFLLRGAVMSGWEVRGGRYAMVVSALLFAGLHGSVIGFPAQAVLGLLLADVVMRTDSIYAGMIYHTLHNAGILIISYLQAGTDTAAATAEMTERGLYAYLGGAAGISAVLFSLFLFGAVMLVCLFLLHRLCRKPAEGRVPMALSAAPRAMDWATLTVFVAGLVTIGSFYVQSLMQVFGGAA